MARLILLDTGPLGVATNNPAAPETARVLAWIDSIVQAGGDILIPEIADYELRRELRRADKLPGIARLDELAAALVYLPITTAAMRHAAEFWSIVRKAGKPTSHPEALDGDAILAGQAIAAGFPDDEVIVATTNVSHLGRFAEIDARQWDRIEA